MKKQNLFKQGNPPAKDAISLTIGRDARPKQRLNPPVFEDAKIDFTQRLGLFVVKGR
jgi:hypothetical protein